MPKIRERVGGIFVKSGKRMNIFNYDDNIVPGANEAIKNYIGVVMEVANENDVTLEDIVIRTKVKDIDNYLDLLIAKICGSDGEKERIVEEIFNEFYNNLTSTKFSINDFVEAINYVAKLHNKVIDTDPVKSSLFSIDNAIQQISILSGKSKEEIEFSINQKYIKLWN